MFFFSNSDSLDIQEKLTEGAAKVVPLGMDEFMTDNAAIGSQKSLKGEVKSLHNDSGEFPDLLDSGNNLATLNSNYNYSHFSPTDDKLENFLKSAESIKEEAGLTFTTLNGLKPEYPDIDVSSFEDLSGKDVSPVVVAKKSVVQLSQVKPEIDMQIKTEQIEMEEKSAADITTIVTESAVKNEPVTTAEVAVPTQIVHSSAVADQSDAFPNKFSPAFLSTSVEIKENIIVKEEKPLLDINIMSSPVGPRSDKPEIVPLVQKPSIPKPVVPQPPEQAAVKDPTKETFTLTTKAGQKIEVPTIITGGYDFDNLLCLFCEKEKKR